LEQDFWSAVEYGGTLEFLSRLKAREHALMAKWGQDILLEKKWKIKRSQFIIKLDAMAVANGRQNCVRDGSRKRVQRVM